MAPSPLATTGRADSIEPVDVHIASRLRDARALRGVSRRGLARDLGVAEQQIEKYERALNKISCNRLWAICTSLDLPPNWFFQGFGTLPEPAASAANAEQLLTRPNLDLLDGYSRLDETQQRLIRQLIDQLLAVAPDAEDDADQDHEYGNDAAGGP